MSKIAAVLAPLLWVACASSSTSAPPPRQAQPPLANVAPATPAATTAAKPFPKLDPAIYEAKIARAGQTNAPTIEPLPEYQMGIAACDDLLVRITACRTLPNKPKVFVRALWDVSKDKLDHGGDRAEIERSCAQEAESWDHRLPTEQPGC
jgi:hypothetical protein